MQESERAARDRREPTEAGGVVEEEDRKSRDIEEAGALEGAKTLTLNLALIPC